MKKRNIYQNQSQELLHIFEKAGSNQKGVNWFKTDHTFHDLNRSGPELLL